MKYIFLVCAIAGFTVAIAGEPGPDAGSTVLVDLDKVAESGTVAPVDGISAAGQPDAQALKAFADSGYRAVIDLRGKSEQRGLDEKAQVEELGMNYVSLPILSEADISFANAARLDQYLRSFDGPVLVHCASGNRVGALLALRQSLAGADEDSALNYGRASGLTRLESVVRQRLDQGPTKQVTVVKP